MKLLQSELSYTRNFLNFKSETLAETIESGPLYITDNNQNKSVAYF